MRGGRPWAMEGRSIGARHGPDFTPAASVLGRRRGGGARGALAPGRHPAALHRRRRGGLLPRPRGRLARAARAVAHARGGADLAGGDPGAGSRGAARDPRAHRAGERSGGAGARPPAPARGQAEPGVPDPGRDRALGPRLDGQRGRARAGARGRLPRGPARLGAQRAGGAVLLPRRARRDLLPAARLGPHGGLGRCAAAARARAHHPAPRAGGGRHAVGVPARAGHGDADPGRLLRGRADDRRAQLRAGGGVRGGARLVHPLRRRDRRRRPRHRAGSVPVLGRVGHHRDRRGHLHVGPGDGGQRPDPQARGRFRRAPPRMAPAGALGVRGGVRLRGPPGRRPAGRGAGRHHPLRHRALPGLGALSRPGPRPPPPRCRSPRRSPRPGRRGGPRERRASARAGAALARRARPGGVLRLRGQRRGPRRDRRLARVARRQAGG